MEKYEFTGETKLVFPKTLKRIRALVDFYNVKQGDVGGWIEDEKNLSQNGVAWVYGNAMVSGSAQVYGNALVCGNAMVCGNARVFGNAMVCDSAMVSGSAHVCGNAMIEKENHIFQFGGIRPHDNFVTFMRSKDQKILVSCMRFLGTIQEFEAKVKEMYGDSEHAKAYLNAIELAKSQIDDVEDKKC